jgi:hypothetical protein
MKIPPRDPLVNGHNFQCIGAMVSRRLRLVAMSTDAVDKLPVTLWITLPHRLLPSPDSLVPNGEARQFV